ncbi:hypothetical protein BDV12DRAFT_155522 [Aspergillus spectabilis]
MQNYTQPEHLKQLQRDLSRKYELHGERISDIWHSWSPLQRARALKAGAADGVMLQTRTDRSLGNVRLIIPDWNLRDLTESDPETFMSKLRHRATTPLNEQYARGPNGGPGDADIIFNSMQRGLEHVQRFRNEFTRFWGEDDYGESSEAKDAATYRQVMAGLATAVNARLVVPRATGELIMQRQGILLQSLNILVEDILDLGSTSRAPTAPKKKPKSAKQANPVSSDSKPEKLPLREILKSAQELKSSAEDHLALCRTECAFLAPIVNMWFATRPELLPDERGQRLPLYTDKYKSIAFFDVLHSAVVGATTWGYLYRLLDALHQGPDDKTYRAMVIQELSNVCHFEYDRVQRLFKRYVQTCSGSKYFRRASGGKNTRTARVIMKVKPESLAVENPQLQYILTLCDSKTTPIKSIPLIKKLDELHNAQPLKLEELMDAESDALGDLAVTAGFIQTLAASLPLPPPNGTKGQVFISGLKSVTSELDLLKDDLDLSDFVVPIDHLLEPGVARQALIALDNFVTNKAGAGMGLLYEGLSDDSMVGVQAQFVEAETLEKQMKDRLVISETPISEPPNSATIIQQRREKAKTRPAHSSAYSIVPQPPLKEAESNEPSPIYRVKQATFDVFSTLFSKVESRGSVTWIAFQGAMADLKFSVVPRFGSIFTFLPPSDFSPPKPFTIHRPHQSRIEGYKLIYFGQRLKRMYGWGDGSFEVA